MIKSLQQVLKQDREKMEVPKSVQQTIPIRHIWPDGIFQCGNKFSKTVRMSDINYATASKEDKTEMFLDYSALLNSLDPGCTAQITINNKHVNRGEFEKNILFPLRNDRLDAYRKEYNDMLLSKVTGESNSMVQDRYLTLSVHRKNVEEARIFFNRAVHELKLNLSRLGSSGEELDAGERLRIFHDFFRAGEEASYRMDIRETDKKGHDVRDYICPDSLEFNKDYFVMGNQYGRVLFLREYATYIKDSMIRELMDINRNAVLSIHVIPIPTDEAVREMQNKLLGVESNVASWQRRQNANNNYSAIVPYEMEQQREETREMLADLTERNQRLMFVTVAMAHMAPTKEALDSDTDTILSVARKHLCQMGTLNWQQADGLNTALPYGLRRVEALRTLTTEALSVLMPFKVQEVLEQDGLYYGVNSVSKNLIVADRRKLLNANAFIAGVSGAGKSFQAKMELCQVALSDPTAEILVLDPEKEFGSLVRALGGEVIDISASSPNHINAMDMTAGYSDEGNPVALKSEFVLSLCEQLMGAEKMQAKEKSIIDRCMAYVYKEYIKGGYTGQPPTLREFHAELLRQSEPEAKEIALAIELFVSGSLNTFAKPTNVDTHNRILCFDIRDLGRQLMPVGMLVVLDAIFNRIIKNKERGVRTWIYIDEIYLLFAYEYSANFLYTWWKRLRKYAAAITGITQNISDLLQSHTARTMLGNSEFLVLLNQSANDREELASLLNISEVQLSYLSNADAGHGLIKCGSAILPFENVFPKNELYRLMTTRPADLEVWG